MRTAAVGEARARPRRSARSPGSGFEDDHWRGPAVARARRRRASTRPWSTRRWPWRSGRRPGAAAAARPLTSGPCRSSTRAPSATAPRGPAEPVGYYHQQRLGLLEGDLRSRNRRTAGACRRCSAAPEIDRLWMIATFRFDARGPSAWPSFCRAGAAARRHRRPAGVEDLAAEQDVVAGRRQRLRSGGRQRQRERDQHRQRPQPARDPLLSVLALDRRRRETILSLNRRIRLHASLAPDRHSPQGARGSASVPPFARVAGTPEPRTSKPPIRAQPSTSAPTAAPVALRRS